MTTSELCRWLRDNSSGVYRPALEAADRLEQMERALTDLSKCKLSEENCASFEVANLRIHNAAQRGLKC